MNHSNHMFRINEDIKEDLFAFLNCRYPGRHVYIKTTGIGCAGPTFILQEKEPGPHDISEEINGFTFSAPSRISETYGAYLFCKGYKGIRIKPLNKITGGCASCINTMEGHPCH